MGQQVIGMPAIPVVIFFHPEDQLRVGRRNRPFHRAAGRHRHDLLVRLDARSHQLLPLQKIDGDRCFRGHFQPGPREFPVPHGRVSISQVEITPGTKDWQRNHCPGTDLNQVHVPSMDSGRLRGCDSPFRCRSQAAEHRRKGNRSLVVPVDLTVADRADAGQRGLLAAKPLGKPARMPGIGRRLVIARTDLLDRDGQGIPRLGPLNQDRSRHRVALGHRRLVATILAGPELSGEGILRFHQQALSRLDRHAGREVSAKFINQWLGGNPLHGKLLSGSTSGSSSDPRERPGLAGSHNASSQSSAAPRRREQAPQ